MNLRVLVGKGVPQDHLEVKDITSLFLCEHRAFFFMVDDASYTDDDVSSTDQAEKQGYYL